MDQSHDHKESLSTLALGALGAVFGDIGTSPDLTILPSHLQGS